MEKNQADISENIFSIDDPRILLDRIPAVVTYIDKNYRYRYVNAVFEDWFGIKAESVIGKHVSEVMGKDVFSLVAGEMSAALNGDQIHYQREIPYFNGRRYVDVTYTPDVDENGTVKGYISFAKDITEQRKIEADLDLKRIESRQFMNELRTKAHLEEKNAELEKMVDALRKQNEFVETILNSSQDLICVYDKNGRFVSMNEKCRKLSWVPGENVIGKTFEEVYPSLIGTHVHTALKNALKGVTSMNATYKSRISERLYTTYFIPLKEKDEVYGALVVAHDDTDLHKATDQLIQTNMQLERMTGEVEDYAILMLDKEGNILNWNKGAEKIKGYKAEEIVGKNFRVFYPEEAINDDVPGKLIRQAAEEGKATHEGWRLRKDGSMFWGSIVITALHDDKNELIGFTKVTRDLTDKKLAEDQLKDYTEQLKQKNEELLHTNSELEQFAYVASHDLQEPLRKIQIFSTLLGKNLNDKEQADKYFEKINASARRMSALIKALLHYSRLSRAEEPFAPTDLNIVLDDVKSDFELLIAEKDVTIHSRNLPVVPGIPVQLHQLFSNLLSNSIKFNNRTPIISISTEEVTPEEKVEHELNGPFIKIIFKDNGIGFDQKYAEQIFTIFQRLNGRFYEGTGIGLAICKRIIVNHHGLIFAHSEKNQGATFTIYLPSYQ